MAETRPGALSEVGRPVIDSTPFVEVFVNVHPPWDQEDDGNLGLVVHLCGPDRTPHCQCVPGRTLSPVDPVGWGSL